MLPFSTSVEKLACANEPISFKLMIFHGYFQCLSKVIDPLKAIFKKNNVHSNSL